ncbi:MAG: hypothetical protein KAQ62_25110, partial [Cyclobacteriaceae bacterium]|nr:hypothetical protein [Cyclobacteriaceae bacterium]
MDIKTMLQVISKSIIIALSLLIANYAFILAQTQLSEDIKGIITESDQPNNDAVPGTIITSGDFERIIIIRLKHNTDVLTGLQEAVKQEQIKNAVIIS